MYLDLCLSLWSILAQAPLPEATGAATPAGAASVAPPPPPATVGGEGLGVVRYILMAVYLVVCLGLIFAVIRQSGKNEGLGGMLGGGGSQNVFRGKKSMEEQLNTVTNYLAVTFMVLSMVISLVMR